MIEPPSGAPSSSITRADEKISLTDLQSIATSRDATPADAIDGVASRWVTEPSTVEEAAAVLALASRHGLVVAPRGAGTALSLGNPPARLDLILSTQRLNRVREHAAGDLVAVLEAGVPLAAAQAVFRGANQWLAVDPPEESATIGGIIAANASGPHRLRYGTMRDLLIGLTYILPDGTVAHSGGKVVKNVAGYDLGKLFTGSLGTLGLIAEAIVRLHPLPEARRTVVVRGGDPAALGEVIQHLLHSTLVPATCEFVVDGGEITLSVLFEGIPSGVEAQATAAVPMLAPLGMARIVDEAPSFPGDAAAEPDAVIKVSIPPAALSETLTIIRAALQRHNLSARIHGHAATAILFIELHGDPEALAPVVRETRAGIHPLGGFTTLQSGSPALKHLIGDVWDSPGDALPLMRRVKERFDPNGIMNPHRYVGGL